MTLIVALRRHTGCNHAFSLKREGDTLRGRHGNHWDSWLVYGDDAAAGSAVFHGVARWLMSLEGHQRQQMSITDAEYEGFVAKATVRG